MCFFHHMRERVTRYASFHCIPVSKSGSKMRQLSRPFKAWCLTCIYAWLYKASPSRLNLQFLQGTVALWNQRRYSAPFLLFKDNYSLLFSLGFSFIHAFLDWRGWHRCLLPAGKMWFELSVGMWPMWQSNS